MLLRVTAPHFVAGVVLDLRGRVVRCAPITRRWAAGRDAAHVVAFCAVQGWHVEPVFPAYLDSIREGL